MLIKPSYSLVESLLLRKLTRLDLQISPHRKPMLNIAKQIDLPRNLSLKTLENFLGLVALRSGEDLVGFCVFPSACCLACK